MTDGFDEARFALRIAGDPVLFVTHVPLTEVPDGVVNVHGHTHQHQAAGAERHINVCVEQLEYRPRRLTDIRRLARELLGENPAPSGTTAERLAWAERRNDREEATGRRTIHVSLIPVVPTRSTRTPGGGRRPGATI